MKTHFQKLHTLPALLLIFLSIAPAAYARTSLDKITAIINDDIITSSEYETRLEEFKQNTNASFSSSEEERYFRKQVLERIIRDRIQLQFAHRQGIRVDDISLNRSLRKIASNNNMTLDQLSKELAIEGVDYERFREQTRNKITIQKIQQRMVINRIKITDQEVDRLLERNNSTNNKERYELEHILIATPESASPEDIQSARAKADNVINQLQDGKSFHELAVQVSDGSHALDGGHLGWRKASELPDLFVKAAQTLAIGEPSKPLKSASGFHIIIVVDKDSDQQLIKQTLARHILIKPDEITDDEAAHIKLTEIRTRIVNGESFSAMAKEFSQDTGSGANGGDLGWSSPGQYVPEFEATLHSLETGAISQPFRSQFGWHIIEVMDRRDKDESQNIQREQARMAILKKKSDEELRLWLRRIRDEAYVELKPPFANAIDDE